MPDRYGEPRPNRDEPTDPEPDYTAAAKRGRATLNALMGWTQPPTPTNRDETRDETTTPNQPNNTNHHHPQNEK